MGREVGDRGEDRGAVQRESGRKAAQQIQWEQILITALHRYALLTVKIVPVLPSKSLDKQG